MPKRELADVSLQCNGILRELLIMTHGRGAKTGIRHAVCAQQRTVRVVKGGSPMKKGGKERAQRLIRHSQSGE